MGGGEGRGCTRESVGRGRAVRARGEEGGFRIPRGGGRGAFGEGKIRRRESRGNSGDFGNGGISNKNPSIATMTNRFSEKR